MNVITIDIGRAWIKAFLVNTKLYRFEKAQAVPHYPGSIGFALRYLIDRLSQDGHEKIVISTSLDERFQSLVKNVIGDNDFKDVQVEFVKNAEVNRVVHELLADQNALVLDLGHQLFSMVTDLELVRNYVASSSGEPGADTLTTQEIQNHLANRMQSPHYISATALEYAIDTACMYSIGRDLMSVLFDGEKSAIGRSSVESVYLSGFMATFMRRRDVLNLLLDLWQGDFGVQVYLDKNNAMRALAALTVLKIQPKKWLVEPYFENLGGVFVFTKPRVIDLISVLDQEIDLEVSPLFQIRLDARNTITQKITDQGRTLKSGNMGLIFDARPRPLDVYSPQGQQSLLRSRSLIK